MEHNLNYKNTLAVTDKMSIGSRFPRRYTSLTVAIFVLLICLSGLFAAHYFYSIKQNNFTVQVDSLGKLNGNMRKMRLMAEEANQQRQMAFQINPLRQQVAETEHIVHSLQIGGVVDGIAMKPLANEFLQGEWKSIRDIWKNYTEQFHLDEKNIERHAENTIGFAHFPQYARLNEAQLQSYFEQINVVLVKQAHQAALMSQYLAIAGVVLMVLSFLIFRIYFVRQLHWHDQNLRHAHLEVHEILDGLSEGLFLLHQDFRISFQPSKRLKSLLPQLDENGQDFLELVGQILHNAQKLSATKMFIEQLYNPRVVEKLIYGLNPLNKVEMPCPKNPNDIRTIGFHFTRIMKDNQIDKVLVSVKDLTESVRIEARLQREQEQNDLQIEMISKMLNADESIMRGFLHTSLKQLAQINEILKQPENHAEDLAQKIRLISQEVHAFKGEASMLDMMAFRLAAEAFEERIKELRQKRQLSGRDFLPLVSDLDSLIEKLAQAEELHRKITGRLNNPMPAPTAATATDLGTILGKFVVNMGHRHNKSVIMETGGLEHLKQENESFPAIKDMIIQILRNAVVHGIETVRVRTLNNKPSEGHIKLNVLHTGGKIRISIEDDGKGIDLPKLRQKAVEMGLATPEEVTQWSDNQLFALIFRPNFSTLPENESNEDAGRGMGMDVVHSRVKALDGNIMIQTQAGQYTRFTIVLPDNA